MSVDQELLAQMERDRTEATDRVVNSDHPLRVLVSGPGTGKTYVFEKALDRVSGRGLALTFIKKLAAELDEQLRERAATYTFHKYAKMLVYQLAVPGLTADFSLYPALPELTDTDLGLIGSRRPTPRQVERLMQDLDETSRLSVQLMAFGTYYDAASFVDLVYRVFRYLQDNPDRTPKYPLVVVDEYQDFTRLETAFIAQLGFASPLLIAGDDDQALYDFRFASPEHIRALVGSPEVERHELPFCSRCTAPVVAAVNATIERAVDSGHLRGRLDKPYECYLPDKLAASELHPKLIDARCSIHRYMAEYVEAEIVKISPEDIEASREGGYPTVLVVGPGQFVKPIYKHLKEGNYPQADLRASAQPTVEPIDGYRRLANDPDSNLGWRIVVHIAPFAGWEDAVRDSLESGQPLVRLIPEEYRAAHLAIAAMVGRRRAGDDLGPDERVALATALGIAPDRLNEVLGREDDPDEPPAVTTPTIGTPDEEETARPPEPIILCTTLEGAKGLSADHVFIVGCMNGHFPRDASSPTDKEICEFLVALSRTRTACHLVSCKFFGYPKRKGQPPPRWSPSVFLDWVASQATIRQIAKAYWSKQP